jgi:hypothetical protein
VVAFFVDEHNTSMPHAAFRGQTLDTEHPARPVLSYQELAPEA